MHRGALVLLLLLPLALPVAHAAPAEFTFDLVAKEDANGRPVFVGAGATDPTLSVSPGARVTIHLTNAGSLRHNVLVQAPVSAAMGCCLAPGAEDNLTFTIPAGFEGDITYQCALHGDQGMAGILHVGAPTPLVRILSPANGTTVRGAVRVEVMTENATVAGPGASALRYTLDGKPLDGNQTSFVLPTPAKGNHLLAAELVAPDGSVQAGTEAIFFEDDTPVATPPATSTPDTPSPTPTATSPTPGPGLLLVAAAVGLALALRRAR